MLSFGESCNRSMDVEDFSSGSENEPTLMKGNIVKIMLRNFTAYSSIVITPGPKLNLILGPNGAGKSSLVSAIVLGLGGTPKDLGREVQVKDFIKIGAKVAKIKIELFNPDGENYIICRTLTSSRNTWTINGASVTQMDLQGLMKSLNIRVDNLCQILPQEKVLDFSRMNPQMLLKNTELAIGRGDVHEHHEKLIQLTQKVKRAESELNQAKADLDKQQRESDGLQSKVAQLKERETQLRLIDELKIKREWLLYHRRKEELERSKSELEEAKKDLQECRAAEHAILSRKGAAERKVASTRSGMNDSAFKINRNSSLAEEKYSEVLAAHNSINQINRQIQTLVDRKIQQQKALEDLQSVVQHLENEKLSVTEPDESVHREMEDCDRKIASLRRSLNELENSIATEESKLVNVMYEIKAQKSVHEQVMNVKKSREELLSKQAPDVYKALKWIRENKNMFAGNVFEPILLEMNIPNPQHQMYFEYVIPVRDMQAFTCENKDDMRLLISKLRDEMKLKINIVHSGPEHPSSDTFKPAQPMEKMKPYGFYAYMKDLFTAPETIMKYLCRRVNIHNIPLGTSLTNEMFFEVPLTCRTFFSNDTRYDVSVSKYSHEKCIATTCPLLSRGILGNSANVELLQQTEIKLQHLDSQKERLNQQISSLKEQKKTIKVSLNNEKEKKKKLEDVWKIGETIQLRLNLRKENLDRLIEDMEERQTEIVKNETELQSAIQALPGLLNKYYETLKTHFSLVVESEKLEFEMIDARKDVSSANSELENLKHQHKDTLNKVKAMEENVNRLKNVAESALKKARQLCPNYKLNLKVDVLETVEKKLGESMAKVTCLANVNIEVLKQYEELTNEIAKSNRDIECHCKEINTMKEEISELKENWLPLVNDLVSRINTNFAKFLSDMKCAGEVHLSPGSDPNDFENYGIQIRVNYHEVDGELHLLGKFMQSGGEKTVATAVYLIAMQELINVPFRCVDEINQGMDPVNERRVFNILVNAVLSSNSQYLFLTPKLLPDLKYSREMDVLYINCGTETTKSLSNQNVGEENDDDNWECVRRTSMNVSVTLRGRPFKEKMDSSQRDN